MEVKRWQRIEQLYHAALEREAAQRPGFLAEACAEDAALRREVEVLLAANEQASGFLAAPALELEARDMADEMSPSLSLQVGQQLSHYTILTRLGAGGMGEVFLAQDHILERRVALKLLPAQFTEQAERLQRFLREAKAASALNHPNIITIYETGEVSAPSGPTPFIATEFIEGETLRGWKPDEDQRQPQTLSIGIQVASALAAAHRAGIVHRDIKPENIMVRPDGLVKVLDFGLAKLTPTGSVDSEGDTLIKSLHTQPGMILGTLRYMSPEQARGRGVDARSDIFSLGVVLYELLTGQPLFAGDTDADIVAAIIHKQAPPLAEYLSEVPAELERIVQKALAKNKAQRYQDAGDLQVDLQALKDESELSARLKRPGMAATRDFVVKDTGAMSAPRFSLRQVMMGLAAALLIAGVAGWFLLKRRPPSEAPPRMVEIVSWRGAPGEVYSLGSLSPDARRVAYSSTESGAQNIWVKSTLSGKPLQITTDGSLNDYPIWSPDGEEVAFFSLRGNQTGIWRIPYFGGTPKEIAALDNGEVSLRHWVNKGARSTIYYMAKRNLFALDVETKQVSPVTHFDAATEDISAISISADEQRIAYVRQDKKGRGSLWFMPASGGTAVQVAGDPAEIRNPVWHPDGRRLLYSASVDGIYQIFVAYTDGRAPVQSTFGDQEAFVLDVSSDGTKVLYGSSREDSAVWGVGVEPTEEFNVSASLNCELWPDAAPDGKTVAYQSIKKLSQGDKLMSGAIMTRAAGQEGQAVELVNNGFLPRWSPDGAYLAFMRINGDSFSLYSVRATGSEETLLASGLPQVDNSLLPYNRTQESNYSWSPDSRRLVYCAARGGQRNLWIASAGVAGDTQLTTYSDPSLLLYSPLWSVTDRGQRVAYTSKPDKPGAVTYTVWVVDTATREAKAVFQSDAFLRLLGWSADEQGLILATLKSRVGSGSPTTVALLEVPIAGGRPRPLVVLEAAYLYNIHLSPDKKSIACVLRQDGKDNLWVMPTGGGLMKKLTANPDRRLYFSSLAWSPDSKAIYFGKQSRYSLLSMMMSLNN